MFQFARLSSWPYVFRPGSRRITSVGFPHSEIHGSKAVQRLTVAYRSRPRPSSTPDAKASTVCPSYLDGDQSSPEQSSGELVIPNFYVGQLCGFQGPARGRLPRRAPIRTGAPARPVSQNSTARVPAAGSQRPPGQALRPGSVDMLGTSIASTRSARP